ncbi:MAG: DNA helicase UvrD [candidate division Zixibacteria bacterium RBG_16_48_11]|nr:MAG: DNA helicase UvrD [candidate division Zixibacteria bacterium RBG_16_48_11]
MRIIADLHLHSKYSRATSADMDVDTLAKWGKIKGINLIGTGDFTHPSYFHELKAKLEPSGKGLFKLKNDSSGIHFLLSVEVSNVYSQGGKLRKIHTILFAPTFEIAEQLNQKLSRIGKLTSDGRPTFGATVKDIAKIVYDTSTDCILVPAHAWTPWFSIFGSNSGFDSIPEAFGEYSKQIFAIETGLSSDPPMNWRVSALDKVTLISNSDAHSAPKLGREANVFDCEMDYKHIWEAVRKKDKAKFLYTIEFFPEEGKYHFDGHRKCNVSFKPSETKKAKSICPVCGRGLTVGVLNRVEKLADRPEGFVLPDAIPYKNMIPLAEIIGEALGQSPDTKGVEKEYIRLIQDYGSEFNVLLDVPISELERSAPPKVAEGVKVMREGKVKIEPGYDGVYGKVSLFGEQKKAVAVKEEGQLGLFG